MSVPFSILAVKHLKRNPTSAPANYRNFKSPLLAPFITLRTINLPQAIIEDYARKCYLVVSSCHLTCQRARDDPEVDHGNTT